MPKRKNNSHSKEELISVYGPIRRRTISLNEALGTMFGGSSDTCCSDAPGVIVESWLDKEIDKRGLFDEYYHVQLAMGDDGIIKFLQLNGLDKMGGWTDERVEAV